LAVARGVDLRGYCWFPYVDLLMDRARATEESAGTAHAVALRAVARIVFTHAFAEEAVLFPAARRALPEGDPLTLQIETDHQQVNELMTCECREPCQRP
jgi:hypothetical protein